MNFGENLLKYANNINISSQKELSKKLKESEKTISSYITKRSCPTYKKLVKFCNLLKCDPNTLMKGDFETDITNITPRLNPEDQYIIDKYKALTPHDREIVDYIMNIETTSESQKPKIIYIEKSVKPVRMKLQSVSAGYGEIIDDTSEYKEDFPVDIVPDNASYGIRVNGDSMEPTIMNGQIIWVEERKDRLPDGSIGIFNTEQGQVCKIFYQDGIDGTITLVSKNNNYSNIIIDNPDFNDIMQGRVIGWCDDPKREQ